MPALPAVSKVVRVDFHQLINGAAPCQNRVFFQYAGALSSADAQTWANAIAAAWVTRILPQQGNDATLVSTTLTDLTSNSAPQVIATNTGTGSLGGSNVSNAVSAVVKCKINRRYRGGHPRHYLQSPTITSFSNSDAFTPTYITNLTTAWNNFISDSLTAVPVAAAPATEVNVSYFSGFHNVTFPSGRQKAVPTPRVTPVVDTVISHSVNPKPASQRRRNLQSS